MIMSVSTLINFKGAATPSSVVNLSMGLLRSVCGSYLSRLGAPGKPV
jgi:hypothetical protein